MATLRKFNLKHHNTIYRWVRKYETVGFMRKENRVLSANKKLEVLEYYWKMGQTETELKFLINSGTLSTWNKMYEEHGLNGLKNNPRGRKKTGKKYKDMTDQEKVAYLELENEYLKKLDALVTKREERERKKK